ncbi:MAG: 8-oxo-dGTP diphosphatase [Candidatus Hydrothermia bacterium]|jgi:8-oxo-dGTP pyrophosphatase MutT (NUDIX family)
MKPIKATLLYLLRDGEILLVYKKRGHGEGKWNGIGGKLDNESVEECVKREVKEETGLEVLNFELCGIIYFYNVYGRDWDVFVFRGREFIGEPKETEEVIPKWFKVTEIPYEAMWEDDREWLPKLIEGKHFIGIYHFDGDKLVKSNLRIVSKVELQEEYQRNLKN